MNEKSTTQEIRFRELQAGKDGSDFRTLNEEWISHYFVLEAKDKDILGNPESRILEKGGKVLYACTGDEVVGCVALIPVGSGVYELSKMAVAPAMRGRGIGRKLLVHAIEQGRLLGAQSLFLGSSSRLKNAVHLYESLGFRHVPPESLPDMKLARADIFMDLTL